MGLGIGYAKNEAFELIFGNALIGLGGFLLGNAYSNEQVMWLQYPSFVIFGMGIIFDVRVLRKFSYELSLVKKDLNDAKSELAIAKKELGRTKIELENEQKDMRKTIQEIQNTKRSLIETKKELDNAERKMKEITEKVFGYSMTVSKSSWSNPLDRIVDELKRKVTEIEHRLDRINRGR